MNVQYVNLVEHQILVTPILGKWNDEEGEKGNRLIAIPQEIFSLTNLKELSIAYNQITAIPDAIANLANLTTLDLDNNQITAIPDAIANLANLTSLLLSYNQITAIPDAIANLADLAIQFQIFPDKFFLKKISIHHEPTAI